MTKEELIAFEEEVEQLFLAKKIRAPIHLSNGNENVLIEFFKKYYNKGDWIFSNWRNHYHILLAGADPAWVKQEILKGHSMSMSCKDPKFIASSIVGGLLGQAVGAAYGLKEAKSTEKVICFLGDMTAETGAFHEARKYATNFNLPILFVIEDNGVSVGTPTNQTWGFVKPDFNDKEPLLCKMDNHTYWYQYKNNKWPHVGIPEFVTF